MRDAARFAAWAARRLRPLARRARLCAARRGPPRIAIAALLFGLSGALFALAGPLHLECWETVREHCSRAFTHRAHGAAAWLGQIALVGAVFWQGGIAISTLVLSRRRVTSPPPRPA